MENRLIEVEIKLAYQEDLLHALNITVTKQQQDIVRLTRTCELLYERLKQFQADKSQPIHEPPPPHY